MMPSDLYPGFKKGGALAVGTLAGLLHIYDAQTLPLQRTYHWQQVHTQRIGALAWNTHVLSSGTRDKSVHHNEAFVKDVADINKYVGGGGDLATQATQWLKRQQSLYLGMGFKRIEEGGWRRCC